MGASARGGVRTAAGGVGVLEVDPTGHRLQYVRHLHEAAGAERCLVFVPGSATRVEEYRHLGAAASSTSTVPGGGAERDRALAGAVAHALTQGLDRLVIPEADLFLVPLLRLLLRRPRLPLNFRLVLMRTSAVGGPAPFTPALVVKHLLVRLLRLFRQVRVHFLTDALGVVESRRGFGGIIGVRDPVARPSVGEGVDLPGYPRRTRTSCSSACSG